MENYITGERIKTLREEKNWTKEKLSIESGVNRTAIYRYESGILTKISYPTLVKLANALGTTARYLNGDTDNKNPNITDILETSGAYTALHDLFRDETQVSYDDLYECTDKEKDFIKKIINNTHMLSDDNYDSLNKVFDAMLNTNKLIESATKKD